MTEEKTNRELNMGTVSKSQTSEGAGDSRTGGEPLDLKGIYEWLEDPVEWAKKLATEHWKEQKEIAQKQQNITGYDISLVASAEGASLQKPEKTTEIKKKVLGPPKPKKKVLGPPKPKKKVLGPPLGSYGKTGGSILDGELVGGGTLQPPTDWSKEPLPPGLEKRIEDHYSDAVQINKKHGWALIEKTKNNLHRLRQIWSKQTKEQLLKEKEKWEEELKKKNSLLREYVPAILLMIDQLLITNYLE